MENLFNINVPTGENPNPMFTIDESYFLEMLEEKIRGRMVCRAHTMGLDICFISGSVVDIS
jgi:hypothetical protein